MELCLGEWTPRNVYRRTAAVATNATEECVEALRTVLMPRLVRVLAPFPEARAAVVAMFLEMHRARIKVPGCAG